MKVGELTTKDSEKLLRYAISEGIISVSSLQEQIDMQENKKILKQHKYSIWQGKNGKWYTYLPDEERGKILKKRTSKEDIEEVVIKYYKEKDEHPTVKKEFYNWLNKKYELAEISKGTYDRYIDDYKRFIEGKDIENKNISSLTESYLEDFIKKSIKDEKLTAKGYAKLRLILRGMLKHSKKLGHTDISQSEFFGDLELSRNIFEKHIKNKELEVFSEEEIEILSSYLLEHRSIQNLGILLAFQTGVRVGELCTIKKSDIIGQTIHIQRTEIKYKDEKTGEQNRFVKEFPKSESGDRYIIITPKAIKYIYLICQLNPDGEFLFEKNGKRIYVCSFDYHIRKACRECGIPVRSMHKIRKTYGTTLLDGDVDESLIMSQMGHSDIKCTKQYYYFSNKNEDKKEEQIRKALNG